MFKPLQIIFAGSIFQNPATDKYAWVGADKASVILLNDLRWSKELIPWQSMLLLLEGDVVNLPAPKISTVKTFKLKVMSQFLQPART